MKKAFLIMCVLLMALLLTGCGCKHENTQIINAKEPGCTEEGYTGDTFCTKCEKTIAKGSAIAAAGHVAGEPVNATAGTCMEASYSGDIYCSVCAELLTEGTAGDLGDHVPSEDYHRDPTCTDEGWYNRMYCTLCDAVIREEHEVAALGHNIPDPEGAYDATCTEKGYQGNGYCTNCEMYAKGATIARLPHNYVDHVCTECGWQEAGLYDADWNLVMTWEEIKANGLVDNHRYSRQANIISDTLEGTLVIEEDYEINLNATSNPNGGNDLNVTTIYTPYTQTSFAEKAFYSIRNLETVRIFGKVTSIPDKMFYGCTELKCVILPETVTSLGFRAFSSTTSLESIDLPDSIAKIDTQCFYYASALKEITLPASLEEIGDSAFSGCTALEKIVLQSQLKSMGSSVFADCTALKEVVFTENFDGISKGMFAKCSALEKVEFNEGMTTMAAYAFQETALKEMVLPSTMTTLSAQGYMEELTRVDMSKCENLTSIGGVYSCSKLTEIILPPNLVNCGDVFSYNVSLKRVVLPDTVETVEVLTNINNNYNSGVEEIVWPVSLVDGSALTRLDKLTSILYRGTEEQWKATASCDLFPNATITFEYAGE